MSMRSSYKSFVFTEKSKESVSKRWIWLDVILVRLYTCSILIYPWKTLENKLIVTGKTEFQWWAKLFLQYVVPKISHVSLCKVKDRTACIYGSIEHHWSLQKLTTNDIIVEDSEALEMRFRHLPPLLGRVPDQNNVSPLANRLTGLPEETVYLRKLVLSL